MYKSLGILLIFIAIIANPEIGNADSKIRVVCTTGMITDIVREVAAEHASVRGLMKSGIDPHLYRATRSDVALLNSADVVFYNGLLLEGKMSDALVRVASAGRKVFAVTELIPTDFLLEPAEFAGHYDPHVWMDPVAWGSAVKVVSNRLQQIDPAHATFYQQNSSIYLEKISKLHQAALKTLHSIQPESRVLVTAHDAFNYFGKRYGFEVVGIQGISTDSEAGIKDIGRIVDLLIERKVKAVFVESTVSRRNIEALVEGAQARGHTVTIGGQLFSDAMGKEGTYQGTYLGMIDHNVTTITRALGGKVDPAGLFGKSDGHSDQVEDKE